MVPYFSIITPMFNRESTIGRAIESCLGQSFAHFELIVVDDGSTDLSREVVKGFKDPRVHLVVCPTNRGPCPARNMGIAFARGRWYVILDSDFSLLRGALDNLYRRTQITTDDIGNVGSSCLWDRRFEGGYVTPLPNVPDQVLDYVAYLRWSDNLTVSEYFNCIRREVFAQVRYPESRAWETSFHLDLASHWKLLVTRDVLVKVHTDAPNRLTTGKGPAVRRRLLLEAQDKLDDLYRIRCRHGEAIQRYAPKRYLSMLREMGRLSLLCGKRREAIRYLRAYLRSAPSDLKMWAILVFGMIGPEMLAWSASQRQPK